MCVINTLISNPLLDKLCKLFKNLILDVQSISKFATPILDNNVLQIIYGVVKVWLKVVEKVCIPIDNAVALFNYILPFTIFAGYKNDTLVITT